MYYYFREFQLLSILLYLAASLSWAAGGWLLAKHLLGLRPVERPIVGLAAGFVLSIALTNLLAQTMPLPAALGLASLLVLLAGVWAGLRGERPVGPEKADWAQWKQLPLLAGTTSFFWLLMKGHSIFDEFLHIPMISIMAAGDIPPQFYLNPAQSFAYHYGLQIFSAGLVAAAGLFPWSAWDLSRALAIAFTLGLAWLWILRLTRSRAAAWLGALILGFGGGARWLLLLLPGRVLEFIGERITLSHSGADSGSRLTEALAGAWVIEGGPAIAFPFAFHSGLFTPVVFVLGSTGALPFMVLLLLLFASRRETLGSLLLVGVFSGVLALSAEHVFIPYGAGLGLVVLLKGLHLLRSNARQDAAAGIVHRSFQALSAHDSAAPLLRERRSFLFWLGVLLLTAALSMVQGGYITVLARSILFQTPGNNMYGFTHSPLPVLLSGHFGPLSLLNPVHWVLLLAETGPVFLLVPLAVWAVLRWAKRGDSLGMVLGATAALSLTLPLFMHFAVERAMSRMPSMGIWFVLLFAFPYAWRKFCRSSQGWKGLWIAGYSASLLGGLVLVAVQMTGMPNTQLTYFASEPDAAASRALWDRLPEGAQVFDPIPYRGVTLFGRSIAAHETIYIPREDWQALVDGGSAAEIAAAGFSYIYLDSRWFTLLDSDRQQSLLPDCIRVVYDESIIPGQSRTLVDVGGCAVP
jgi:hypothetical protein